MPDLNPQQFFDDDLHTAHRPDATGPQMHALDDAFPGIYEHPEYHSLDPEYDRESLPHIKRVRNKPDAPVTIYRSVPHGETEIHPGDWVSTSRKYAAREGIHHEDPSKDLPVISKKVPAKHLRTESNSVNEWGYFPDRER